MRVSLLLLVGMIFLVFLAAHVEAARLSGKVYGPGLELLKKASVEIREPRQFMIAENGIYSFDLRPGNYTIRAVHYSKDLILFTEESILIIEEGSYTLDLILFETLEEEELELNESEFEYLREILEEKPDYTLYVILGIVIVVAVVILLIFFFFKKKPKKKEVKKKKPEKKKEEKKKEELGGDEVLERILDIVKKEKRITQKEIRKQVGMSEAKISLVIADLQDKGIVRKIKRGRGNIIIYEGKD